MEIKLNGAIMSNDDADIMRWFGWNDNCCPADIENAIANAAEGEELTVWVNSVGGDLFAGMDMYHALKNCGRRTTAKVTTCAASAATVAMMGCEEIEADATSVLCVHDPSAWSAGNAGDLRKTADELDTFKRSIIAAYSGKVNRSDEEMWALMSEDRWMNAEEALNIGLIDRMSGSAADGTVRFVNAGVPCFFPTDEMRKRYQNEKEEQRKRKAECAAVYAEILSKM